PGHGMMTNGLHCDTVAEKPAVGVKHRLLSFLDLLTSAQLYRDFLTEVACQRLRGLEDFVYSYHHRPIRNGDALHRGGMTSLYSSPKDKPRLLRQLLRA